MLIYDKIVILSPNVPNRFMRAIYGMSEGTVMASITTQEVMSFSVFSISSTSTLYQSKLV